MVNESSYDAIIVGAGFNGIQMLHELRKHGFSAIIYEAASEIGGTWFLNRYPGARVDSEYPIYQLQTSETNKDFKWTERFPGYDELRKYFHHIDSHHNFSKDIKFNTRVLSAHFNDTRSQWLIQTDHGDTNWGSHLILCTGFASKKYTPTFPGLNKFKGECYHSGVWPAKDQVNLKGKKVSIIGTGASGVQIIQEIGSEVSHLTVYQRTPNLALPMQQDYIHDQSKWKFPPQDEYQNIIETNNNTFCALGWDFVKQNAMDVSHEERIGLYEKLFKLGGFSFWIGTFQDVLRNQQANDSAYGFWCEKTRARINDPIKKDLLAPIKPPHAIGTKRPCLEQHYYEIFNQDNVDIINVRESPIIEITDKGVKTQKEGEVQVDVLILATGFDSVTGGILDIDIQNGKNESLRNKWKTGTWTNLGITTSGYPNMYFLYGPHAPTAFSNGPSTGIIQCNWIKNLMIQMRQNNNKTIDATPDAENKWKKQVVDLWDATLFPGADSWYQGANIPGKPREPLNYFGGVPTYTKALQDSANNNYEGFVLT